MIGAITTKDVFLHSLTIVRLWGLSTYLSCLRAAITGSRTTFLRVLYPVADVALGASPRRERS